MHHPSEAQWIAITSRSINLEQLDDFSWQARCADCLEEHRGDPAECASIAEMMAKVVRDRLPAQFAALTYLHWGGSSATHPASRIDELLRHRWSPS